MQEEMKRQPAIDPAERKIRDADIAISTIMILGAGWTAWESIRMSVETYRKGNATIFTVPGLFPFIVSLAIIVSSTIVLAHAFRRGGSLDFLKRENLERIVRTPQSWVFPAVLGILAIYVWILIPHLPFTIATILVVIGFMLLFRPAKIRRSLLIGAVYSVIVVWFFATVVGTRFPFTWFR